MKIIKILSIIALSSSVAGCESYLEKTPASDVDDAQVFSSYRNFQGYLDVLYGDGLIVYHVQAYTSSFDFADDVDCNRDFPAGYNIPRGNYMWIHSNLDQNPFVTTNQSAHFGLWDQGWANIRTCNFGLANLDMLTNATPEESNRLKGQMLFFRAWNHFEIAKYWGGLPYVTDAFSPETDMKFPRLSFKETLMKIVNDLTEAAELLPEAWENPSIHMGRVTKGAALALKSRALLYAASPLTSKLETENAIYDTELCKQAAQAAYEVIKLANKGIYSLVPWSDYAYQFADCRPIATTKAVYTAETIFAKIKPGTAIGSSQVLNFGIGRLHNSGRFGGNSVVTSPTANFVDLYETATGYAIADAPSGDYNPLIPWAKRDPRLWKTILVDGVKWVDNPVGIPLAESYVQLYTNVGGSAAVGLDRGSAASPQSKTGYLIRKYIPFKVNNKEGGAGGAEYNSFRFNCPYIRLAEMYLNFAEAVNEAYGPTVSPTDFDAQGLTALEAINILHRRVKLPVSEDLTAAEQVYGNESLPDVRPQYYASKEIFRDRIRNERSVELAFEGQRFVDLRRWYLSHLPQYKRRYEHQFNQEHSVCNETLLFEGQFEEGKHYWFPFKRSLVNQYEDFKQNQGW
ncbi:MAG: RagB/SusD family nutrient uptake outer membrane protein [Dysgonamonadaceae bacterium]|nr:RagB/SusD family nutrient uptake outer membrane protein [Dysgonamonadaceae bacterium]